MIHVKSFTFNPFSENTFVLYDDSKAGVIIDPGCYEDHEREELKSFIETEGIKVEKIINTHCHIDHVLGNYWCQQEFKVPLLIPEGEVPVLQAVPSYSSNYGFAQYQPAKPDGFIDPEKLLAFGESEMKVLLVPGHSPGHLAFYAKEEGFCIGGDVLFQGSIGRTDLPGGNFDQLIRSIHSHFFTLPDNTEVYCGHGPSTNIGFEKVHNPFCAVK